MIQESPQSKGGYERFFEKLTTEQRNNISGEFSREIKNQIDYVQLVTQLCIFMLRYQSQFKREVIQVRSREDDSVPIMQSQSMTEKIKEDEDEEAQFAQLLSFSEKVENLKFIQIIDLIKLIQELGIQRRYVC